MIRVAIVGTRDPSEAIVKAVNETIRELDRHTILVSGGAPGVDTIVRSYRLQYFVVEFHAPWTGHLEAAGPMRNGLIAEYADRVIAFPGPDSVGTFNCIKLFERLGKPVEVRSR